jgi:hypothetical protein
MGFVVCAEIGIHGQPPPWILTQNDTADLEQTVCQPIDFQEHHGRDPPLRAKEHLAADIASARLRIMRRYQQNKVHILL